MLLTWAYGLIYFGLRMPFTDPMHPVSLLGRLRTCVYVSGSTLFTLGLGDVLPSTHAARSLLVVEAGTGLGFVALVIGYVPVLYTRILYQGDRRSAFGREGGISTDGGGAAISA